MARNPQWARDFVVALERMAKTRSDAVLPPVEVAEVAKTNPEVIIRSAGGAITYDEDDVVWGIDRESLQEGDIVLLTRDTSDNPIVAAVLDGNDPDPTLHPKGRALLQKVEAIHSQSRFWKAPVSTSALIGSDATTTDADGTVRLDLTTDSLYRWKSSVSSWVAVSGGGGGASTLSGLTDVTLSGLATGDLIKWNGSAWVNFAPTYAPLASPSLTGVPTGPTAAVDTNTTQLATTAYVVGQGYLKSAAAGSTYQPLDSDLTTLAGLTATTNNFIVSVASAWASRTPAQVKTTLAIVAADVSDFNTAVRLNKIHELATPTATTPMGGFGFTGLGTLEWGGDTSLYRSAAQVLATDGNLTALQNMTPRLGSAAQLKLGSAGPAGEAGILFSNAEDTNLYRSGANVLKTDDTFVAVGNVEAGNMRIGAWVGDAAYGAIGNAANVGVAAGYALIQGPGGAGDKSTYLNALAGGSIVLRIDNATVATLSTTGLAMGGTKVTGLAAASSNGEAVRYEQINGVYQPLDSDLTTLASLTATTDNFVVAVASAWASRTPAQVKTTLSLNNVDNTSDASKPVSTATQTALDLKANLASPTLTGTPAAPTAAVDTNTTQLATTAFVVAQISGGAAEIAVNRLVDGAAYDVLQTNSDGTTVAWVSGLTNNHISASAAIGLGKLAQGGASATDVLSWNGSAWAPAAAGPPALHAASHKSGGADELKLHEFAAPTASVAMGTQKLTGLAAGSVAGDSVRYEQVIGVYQPLDSDLTTLAGLTATTNNFIVSVASAWASRTPAQVKTTLAIVAADVSDFNTAVRTNRLDQLATPAAAVPMGTQKLTGLAAGSANGDSVRYEQVLLLAGGTMAANIAMGGFKVTGLAAASANGEAVRYEQINNVYQPVDSDLTAIAGLTATTDNFIVSVASAWASRTPAQVKTTLALDNVNNTTDANKPVSTAQQTALNLKANLLDPTFTGDPKAPTPAAGDNDTSIATTEFVTTAVTTGDAHYNWKTFN